MLQLVFHRSSCKLEQAYQTEAAIHFHRVVAEDKVGSLQDNFLENQVAADNSLGSQVVVDSFLDSQVVLDNFLDNQVVVDSLLDTQVVVDNQVVLDNFLENQVAEDKEQIVQDMLEACLEVLDTEVVARQVAVEAVVLL